jgi:molybdopterin-binding protein
MYMHMNVHVQAGYAAYAMPRRSYTAAEAARLLGISLDTLRRWDRAGKIATQRDAAGRRTVKSSEVERLGGGEHRELSARNRFRGRVASIRVEGLLAQVEIDVTEPARLVALVTADAVAELGLKVGDPATGIVKATSVMVER